MITLATLFLHIKDKVKLGISIKIFLFFWIMVLLRIFYDLEYRIDYNIPDEFKNQIWTFALVIVLIPMISVIKSFYSINFQGCLKYIQIIGLITLVVGFISFSNMAMSSDRISSVALDPISFGQFGGLVAVLSIYLLKTKSSKANSLILSLFYFVSIFFGVFVLLRTGSRGPMLAFIVTVIFYYAFKSKNLKVVIFRIITPLIIIFIFSGLIVNIIGHFSPVFEQRMTDAISGNDLSTLNRQESYQWFWNEIQDNVLIGSQFAKLSNTDYLGYAHNIFLDIALGLGIIGLIPFLYILYRVLYYVRVLILRNSEKSWMGLITIQYIVLSFFSGAYYSNPILNVSIVLTLLAGNSLYPKNYE